MSKHSSNKGEPVWDLFVRIFHWTLVSCVTVDYFLIDDGKTLHQWVGYLASALVMARIVWGFIGSRYARFSDFFPTPKRLRRHVGSLVSGKTEAHEGHNPLGALMMLALLALVLVVGVTGWMQTLDRYWGEEWLQNLHRYGGNVLVALATLHAVAAIVMGRLERTRLVRAMFTGIKQRW